MDDANNLSYFVVENDHHVCEGIITRMAQFPDWQSLGYSTGVAKAIGVCRDQRPQLLFLDWSLAGGSAYEVLDAVRELSGYNPYIVCFTGYQEDNPDIPMTLVNRYHIDKYLIKPIWAHLRSELPHFLEEARARSLPAHGPATRNRCLLKDAGGLVTLVDLDQFAAAWNDPDDQRCKQLYFINRPKTIVVRRSWQQVEAWLQQAGIDYYMPHARRELVARSFIDKYQAPFIHVQGAPCRFEVVSERAKAFEHWLCQKP